MIRFITIIAALCAALSTAHAEEVVLGLSKDRVSITTNFDGSEILIFGAVKREAAIPSGAPLEVIVTIAGPSLPLTVRRKEKKLGIWVNTDSVEVDRAPSFYAVLTSGPLTSVLNDVDDLRHKISVPRAIRSVGAPADITDAVSFTDALIRIKEAADVYQLREGAVEVTEQTLFRTSVRMPAALTEGDYATRIFLTRGGEVISTFERTIDVQKVGLERWLYEMSRNQAMLYGLMSLAIAIFAGWAASAVFRFIRT